MNLTCQASVLSELRDLADSDRHSILIAGKVGCGKTYLAKQYATMLGISDFLVVNPTVPAIKDSLTSVYSITSRIVLCIENLDSGLASASHALLKFLEEPLSHVYVVITCRNSYAVPDTIISRCACVEVASPIPSDIDEYAEITDSIKYHSLRDKTIWAAVKSFRDVDIAFKLSSNNFEYYNNLETLLKFKDSCSNIVWKLSHYDDGSETNVSFVLNYLMYVCQSSRIQRQIIECSRALNEARVASHAILSKFVFDCKYGV